MKRAFLSLLAFIVLAFSLNSFTTISKAKAMSSDVYIYILDGNAYELTNDTDTEVDSWRLNVTFYDAANNIIETERYSGDNFDSVVNACGDTPANCVTVKAYLWARLIDDRVFTDTKIHQSDC
ncbi:MAG: hypothetical protein JEZ09_10760 [Salinivirgaceae bacterium]|nr:hypothetical protein [Salinivirgaceae bacterium]